MPLVTDEIYHVLNRGVARAPIFSDKKSYERFILALNYYQYTNVPIKLSHYLSMPLWQRQDIVNQLQKENKRLVEIMAFCLMPNHFHLLLKQLDDGGISLFMRKAGTSYGHYFNLRTDRIGPLVQGIFKAVQIVSEEQLLHVIRYIHINPYVGMVVKKDELLKYSWSSLADYLRKQRSGLICEKVISEYFKTSKSHLDFIKDEADFKRQEKEFKYLDLE